MQMHVTKLDLNLGQAARLQGRCSAKDYDILFIRRADGSVNISMKGVQDFNWPSSVRPAGSSGSAGVWKYRLPCGAVAFVFYPPPDPEQGKLCIDCAPGFKLFGPFDAPIIPAISPVEEQPDPFE